MFAKCPLSAGMLTPLIIGHLVVLVVTVFDNEVFFFFGSSSSLDVCASSATTVSRKSILLNVCKMHALKCIGKNHMIVEDSTCTWPERSTTGCAKCHIWETCNGRNIKG